MAHDARLFRAFGPSRSDVVLAHHLEQRTAGDPGDDRERDGRESDGRQDQVLDRIPEHFPLRGDQGIEDVEVRDELMERRPEAFLVEIPTPHLVVGDGEHPGSEPTRWG